MKKLYCAFNATRQSFISLGVTIADTPLSRLRGLLGKMRMRSDEALWVVPSRGVHTIGLRFAIDVLYLDSRSRVIYAIENLGPLRIPPVRWDCASVLELPVRSIFDSGTQVGDQIMIRLPEDMNKYWETQRTGGAVTNGSTLSLPPGVAAKPESMKQVPQWLFGNDPKKG